MRTNNLNRVFIDGNGNVGIGISTPVSQFQCNGNAIIGSLGDSSLIINNGAGAKYRLQTGSSQLTIQQHTGVTNTDYSSWTSRINIGDGSTEGTPILNLRGISLGSSAGNTVEITQFGQGTSSGDGGYGKIRLFALRSTNGNDWTTSSIYMLYQVDITQFGYIRFAPSLVSIGVVGGAVLNITSSGVSKSSGTFDIQHPLSTNLNERLRHSFVEGPRADNIYRGTVQLINGVGTVNLNTDCVESIDCAMRPGTFSALNKNPQFFLQNTTSFDRVIGSISNDELTIRCENNNSVDIISWMVVGERQDAHMKKPDNEYTNKNGSIITEYLSTQY